jgi:hypothetical protein
MLINLRLAKAVNESKSAAPNDAAGLFDVCGVTNEIRINEL